MQIIFTITCFLLFAYHSTSQQILLPYLSGTKYGVADENGRLIIQPQYDAVITKEGSSIIQVKQNGFWGFVNTSNEVVLPITMLDAQSKDRYDFNRHGPIMRNAIYTPDYRKVTGPFSRCQLQYIYDGNADKHYYINAHSIQKTYTAFLDPKKVRKGFEDKDNDAWTGMIKVGTYDQQINFIDTFGLLVLKNGIYDGDAISPHLIDVKGKTGMHALWKRNGEALTDFVYKDINFWYDHGFVVCSRIDSTGKYPKSKYTIYNWQGKMLWENLDGDWRAKENLIILKYPGGSMLADSTGKEILDYKNASLSFIFEENKKFLLNSKEKYGLVGIHGDTILEPIYTSLSRNYKGDWKYKLDHVSGVMDSLFNVKWKLDSLDIQQVWPGSDKYFYTSRNVGSKKQVGLVDKDGIQLLEPIYKEVTPGQNYILAKMDTLYMLLDDKGEVIIPLTDSSIHVNTSNSHVSALSNNRAIVYNIDTRQRENTTQLLPLEVKEEDGKKALTDLRGDTIFGQTYHSIKRLEGLVIPRAIFLTSNLPGSDWRGLIDESGKSILPEGYGIYHRGRQCYTVGGLIVVIKRSDIEAMQTLRQEINYRSGVIDADGKWVLGPDYMEVRIIGKEFIKANPFDKSESRLYDRFGKLIISDPKFFLRDLENDKILHDRVIAGVFADTTAYRKLIERNKNITEMRDYKRVVDEAMAMLILGCIDHTGKVVIPFIYTDIRDFKFPLTTVKGIDASGKNFSAVINLEGKELFRTPYDELVIQEKDSSLFSFKSDGKYGLMDITGKIIFQPKYRSIVKDPWLGHYVLTDATSTYLAPYHHLESLTRIGPPGKVQFHKWIDFAYTTLEPYDEQGDKKYFYTFDQQGNPLHSFSGYYFSDMFMGRSLPSGFMGIRDSMNGPEYVVNANTGFVYRAKN